MKLYYGDDWQKLVDDNGNTIIEGHRLDVKDVLFALGYCFEIEELGEDD